MSSDDSGRAPRVLFLGENWYGSCARACCAALRRLGCEVSDLDVQTIFPLVRRRSSRLIARMLRRRLIDEYNELILDTARIFKPELLLAFKGSYVLASTLRDLRRKGAIVYNFFPDPSPFGYDAIFADSMREYDCVFYTKRYWHQAPFLDQFRASAFVAHGYDSEVHRSNDISDAERREYGHDVAVVATHSYHKEELLNDLLARLSSLDLVVWGNGWSECCRSKRVRNFVQGMPVNGTGYAKVVRAAKINIAIMHGTIHPGVSQADETTSRTYEIPACGGFMLHERSPELLTLFREDEEVVCFESAAEAAAKIEYYLARPAERNAISRAGHTRCVPAYSYDNRMIEVLNWHAARAYSSRI